MPAEGAVLPKRQVIVFAPRADTPPPETATSTVLRLKGTIEGLHSPPRPTTARPTGASMHAAMAASERLQAPSAFVPITAAPHWAASPVPSALSSIWGKPPTEQQRQQPLPLPLPTQQQQQQFAQQAAIWGSQAEQRQAQHTSTLHQGHQLWGNQAEHRQGRGHQSGTVPAAPWGNPAKVPAPASRPPGPIGRQTEAAPQTVAAPPPVVSDWSWLQK